MVAVNFKSIRAVPAGKEIIDVVLSRTQRGTPTVIHPGYKITRIRAFYMRKVKYTSETVSERLSRILEDFPALDELHPFFSDLCNVLYDRDHYKLALGQLNVAKHLCQNVSRDYVRMLKYADTLYRAKSLKRAALGRMATILRKQAASLSYLEEVRKHLSRLPSIDPNSRTLLITGYPNVGKSSFMNQVTHADVDVQPYAFTTKSLFVGHMDYKLLPWQVIDSPGVLDKPLEERNTIEMQAITALAHLQACVLYFFDVSELCGWTLEQQIALFHSLRPLFANKPLVIVCNKVDVVPLETLDPARLEELQTLAKNAGAVLMPCSAMNAVGIAAIKHAACDALLERRVEAKSRNAANSSSSKLGGILNRLTVTRPAERDDVVRAASIPPTVLAARAAKLKAEEAARKAFRKERAGEFQDPIDAAEAEGLEVVRAGREALKKASGLTRLAKDDMWENGGPGVYAVDLRTHYRLHNPDWHGDAIPEIMDGKNIADFLDPDIEARLDELEREEEELARDAARNAGGEYEGDDASDLDEEELETLGEIREARANAQRISRLKHKRNSAPMPKSVHAKHRTPEETIRELKAKGYDPVETSMSGRKRTHTDAMEVEDEVPAGRFRKNPTSGGPRVKRARGEHGADSHDRKHRVEPGEADKTFDTKRGLRAHEVYADVAQRKRAELLQKRSLSIFKVTGRAGEADRKSHPKLVKHMIAGKLGRGKRDHR